MTEPKRPFYEFEDGELMMIVVIVIVIIVVLRLL